MRRPYLTPFALIALASFAACAPQAAAPAAAPQAAAPAPTSPSQPAQPAPAAAVTEAKSGYDTPPKNVYDVLHAPSPPSPSVSPTGDTILLVSWVDYPSMARVAEPFIPLAGVRVEPKTRRKHDTPGGYGITPCARDFSLMKVSGGAEVHVALPPGGCVEGAAWAADGKHFVFRNTAADSVELWVGDATTGAVHVLAGLKLNPMLGTSVQWMPDQKHVLVKLVPDNAGPPPPAPVVPVGPSIQETTGQKGESSTYELRDTLTNKHDEDLFDYYATSQLAVVDIASGAITRIGKPGIYTDVDAAPDGEHILVESIHKPYSYVTTFERFPHDVQVWDHAGNLKKAMASLPLADRVPVHGVPTGPRHFSWRATEPATLTWAEALDGGDWKVKVPARDKVLMQKAPFTAAPVEITRTEQRYAGLSWGEQPALAFLREYDENRHWTKTFTMNVDDRKAKPKVLWDHSSDERYKHPGSPIYRVLPNGSWVVRQQGDSIFLTGAGASTEGDRPFFDRLNLKTHASERLFRCDKTSYESFLAFGGEAGPSFLTWHQTPSEPPNAFMRTVGAKAANAPAGEAAFASTSTAITHIPDPTPAVRAIKKRLVKYKRKDGMDLSFTLYTPPDYKEGTRVPAILNAYPLDFADASKAGQVSGSEQTFTRLRQYQLLLLAGYAIIDRASFPIVGDPKKAYDTYLEQLTADAKAAVDKAVEIGVVDPERIGITGHSHGALMTANLLAHTDLFRAGIATSGSYNKTLTPFGFQNERRSVWEAQNVYVKASPFFVADKLKLPILIMHGEDDANPGTTPLQAKKLYEAIRGNGGTARLVMLPHEPHWYSAMESNDQLVSEMIRWFDKYVKNAQPRTPAAAAPEKAVQRSVH
jgi:dipeptidyl aminopeptidase/acylaminoacyl peptidase